MSLEGFRMQSEHVKPAWISWRAQLGQPVIGA